MIWFLFGAALLVASLLVINILVSVDPRLMAAVLRWTGGSLLLVLALFLAIRGKFVYAAPLAAGAYLLLMRLVPGLSPPIGRRRGARTEHHGTRQSTVETAYLRVRLDHASGEMDGDILEGAYRGRKLSALMLDELLALREMCFEADADSVPLVESFLERTYGADWQAKAREATGRRRQDRAQGANGGATPMSREEAWRVLGLDPGASQVDIRRAHHRLMKIHHPDQGGTVEMAARLNAAKETLLRGARH